MIQRRIKNKQRFYRALIILTITFAVVFVTSLFAVLRIVSWYQNDRLTYKNAADLAVSTPFGTAAPTVTPDFLSNTWKPPEETPPTHIDFSEVTNKSTATIAWLFCADTPVNYPVVFCKDNQYYLTHDYMGKKNKSGAIFFDERISSGMEGDNLIIYGHHMKDDTMFGSILEYQHQGYTDEHKTLYLFTPEKTYRITVFAAWFCDTEATNYPIWFSSTTAKQEFYKNAVLQSTANSNSYYAEDKRMISLVTCSFAKYSEYAYFQVNGWLTEIGQGS